jgi:hypothetical protein
MTEEEKPFVTPTAEQVCWVIRQIYDAHFAKELPSPGVSFGKLLEVFREKLGDDFLGYESFMGSGALCLNNLIVTGLEGDWSEAHHGTSK